MVDEERVPVKTTVPKYQKEIWVEHAEELDMSQSEFVRTMVQSGRRGFELDSPETRSSDANPRGDVLRERVLSNLTPDTNVSFDELVESLTQDIEAKLDETLTELDEEDIVEINPRGGLSLARGSHGDG